MPAELACVCQIWRYAGMELEFMAFKCVGDLCVPLTASRGAFPLCEAALSLLTAFEHCGGKVLHRVPQNELGHVWKRHLLGMYSTHYMIHAASKLNPETLFHREEPPAR